MSDVTLSIPPNAAQVRTARLVAGTAARVAGVGSDSIDELRQAVGEACAQAVLAHRGSGNDDPIDVHMTTTDANFTVRVAAKVDDSASALNSDSHSEDNDVLAADGDSESVDAALAVALIKALTDEVTVSEEDGLTVLTMSWPRSVVS